MGWLLLRDREIAGAEARNSEMILQILRWNKIEIHTFGTQFSSLLLAVLFVISFSRTGPFSAVILYLEFLHVKRWTCKDKLQKSIVERCRSAHALKAQAMPRSTSFRLGLLNSCDPMIDTAAVFPNLSVVCNWPRRANGRTCQQEAPEVQPQ
jgi:hypothetical protein